MKNRKAVSGLAAIAAAAPAFAAGERGASGESSRGEGAAAPATWALQAKWAHPVGDEFSIRAEMQSE
jgi:hypothetical protein